MKAKDLLTGSGELVHKLRSEKDIIRHIKTREGSTANYNVLLGSGASITSGIRTGTDLINEWIKELYERFEREEANNVDEARKCLELKHGSWYNPLNPYSSLFEKKYDLPSQRRRFVECEVDGKLPSIGYAFLTSLIEKNYFHSVFTTNFDDLINEAFYQFSNIRPILCAHDSSVHSISISSKRPKIIKLHGDYLFDDIKSTLRETESLEQNIKEKFIEFCKEYGLIIIGYSGRDRSIMDVLEFLSKQENYLNNGIYWCLREDDEICHTLRNLMWKDKVYPVLIDGFDEFLAETHSSIIKNPLDLESNNNESKLKRTIKNVINDKYNLSKNKNIAEQINFMKKEQSQHDIGGLINSIFDDDDKSDLSLTDFRNLLEIDNLIKKGNLTEAINLAIQYYQNCNSTGATPSYLKKIISLYNYSGDNSNAMLYCDKLINEDDFNLSYRIRKVHLTKSYNEKYRTLKELTSSFSKRSQVYNEIVMLVIDIINNGIDNIDINDFEIERYISKSKKLDPSLSNLIWNIEFDWIKLLIKQTNEVQRKNEYEKRITVITENMRDISDENINTLQILTKEAFESSDFKKTKSLNEKLIEVFKTSSKERKQHILSMLNTIHHSCEKLDDITGEEANSFKNEFYINFINDKDIENECKILIDKAKFIINSKNEFEIAKTYFNNALDCDDILNHFNEILPIADVLGHKINDFINKELLENKVKTSKKLQTEINIEILIREKEYSRAIIEIENLLNLTGNRIEYLTSRSYIYLLEDKFDDVIKLSKGVNFDGNSKYDVFSINFYYAAKKSKNPAYNQTKVLNLSAKPKSVDLRICAFITLDKLQDARRLIKEEILKDRLNYYNFKKWPIIPRDLLEDVYSELFKTIEDIKLKSA